MKFCPLASGSKGNSTLLVSDEVKVLFDAGLSAKALTERLIDVGESIEEIDAIIVTHEHSDHIRGIDLLSKKYEIPIFANSDAAKAILSGAKSRPKFKIFTTGETFHFADLEIHPFSIQHDTLDPVAFTVLVGGKKLGICTDLGFATSLVKAHLKDCDYMLLESNHEPELVYASPRPALYKQRVLSRQGHLSNQACAELLAEVHSTKLKHVFLAHLSSDCNQEDIALERVHSVLEEQGHSVNLSIAFQNRVSEMCAW